MKRPVTVKWIYVAGRFRLGYVNVARWMQRRIEHVKLDQKHRNSLDQPFVKNMRHDAWIRCSPVISFSYKLEFCRLKLAVFI